MQAQTVWLRKERKGRRKKEEEGRRRKTG